MRVKPYKGNENYIFLSYSHKDKQEVMEIVEQLQRSGYNVWFDEGIDPGTEWDENIAAHIENCSYFIAFITENFINSQNCRDELNYARDLEKERLVIYGEDVELPGGMRMRMNRLQAIYKNRYARQEEFYEKVRNAHGIEKCLSKTDADPVPAAGSAGPEVPEEPDPTTGSSSVKSRLILIIAAVLVLLFLIIGALTDQSGSEDDSGYYTSGAQGLSFDVPSFCITQDAETYFGDMWAGDDATVYYVNNDSADFFFAVGRSGDADDETAQYYFGIGAEQTRDLFEEYVKSSTIVSDYEEGSISIDGIDCYWFSYLGNAGSEDEHDTTSSLYFIPMENAGQVTLIRFIYNADDSRWDYGSIRDHVINSITFE